MPLSDELQDFLVGVMSRCQEAISEAQNLCDEDTADEVSMGYVTISAWCEDILDGRSIESIVRSEM